MKACEWENLASRFRKIESLLGLAGCLLVLYAVWSPDWIRGEGLWVTGNDTFADPAGGSALKAECPRGEGGVLEAEQVFAVLAFILAGSCSCVCLLFILCWSSYTSRSYTYTSSQVNGSQVLFPGTLLLVILFPTGLFFLISWSLFTRHHRDEIADDIAQLGSCYWLGALAWVLLLVAVPVTFVIEQFVCPVPSTDTSALLEPHHPSQKRTGAGAGSSFETPPKHLQLSIYKFVLCKDV
ncbi:UNVERIFIED_CONTAM: hypothetical protein FKN15_059137 [Acipenser sinensis]